MKDAKNPDEAEAPSRGQNRPSGPDRQEQYQRTRDQAASSQEEQDRDARIRRRAHDLWEAEGRPEDQADRHWSRAAEDLDREDAAIQREGDPRVR